MTLCVGIEACNKDFTIVVVADETGKIKFADRIAVRLNYYEMTKYDLSTELYGLIKQGIQACDQHVSEFCHNGGNICAGITGVTNKYDREVGMKEVWGSVSLDGANIITTGGIEIAFTGATRSLTGAAITSRSGSAALARNDKFIERVGGWGSLLGDEGSGYWIGIKILNALCRIKDGRLSRDTKLPDFVLDELNRLPLWTRIVSDYECHDNKWISRLLLLSQRTRNEQDFRYIVSDLAKALFLAAEKYPNDELVSRLMQEAANELVDQVECAINNIRLSTNGIPLVLRGGVLGHNLIFSNVIKEIILRKWPYINIIMPNTPITMRPAIGALVFALSGNIFSLPRQEVIQRLEDTSTQFEALDNDSE